jgi:glutamate--cysteine ligase catalytic subunit
LAGKGQRRIYKSRYDSISTYIYQGDVAQNPGVNGKARKGGMENRVLNMYNDIPVPIDEASYKQLREAGIDPGLAQHVAHLFVRDPPIVYEGAVEEVDDETMTEHWENVQSSNWCVHVLAGCIFSCCELSQT